jgi:hypothetical protein
MFVPDKHLGIHSMPAQGCVLSIGRSGRPTKRVVRGEV